MPSPGTTPDRKTVVTIDAPIYGLAEPVFWREFVMDEIGDPAQAFLNKVNFWPEIGWRLLAYQSTANLVHEQSVADDSVLTPANSNATVAAGFLELPMQRWPSELTGGSQGSVRTSGDTFLRKSVASSDSFAVDLSGDAAAFTSPDIASDPTDMDRIYVTTDPRDPNDPICVRFIVPAVGAKATGPLITICFPGLPGCTQAEAVAGTPGTGEYGLKLYADGLALLYERLTPNGTGTWKFRRGFKWCDPHAVTGQSHIVDIVSDAHQDSDGNWQGTKIGFGFNNAAKPIDLAIALSERALYGPNLHFYEIPKSVVNAPHSQVLRLDCRRVQIINFQVSRHKYYASGILQTYTFGFELPPLDTTAPLDVQWFGNIPTGTTLDVALYDASDGSACATVGTPVLTNIDAGSRSFTIHKAKAYYYAIFTFMTSDQSLTPTIQRIRLIRGVTTNLTTPTPINPKWAGEVSITSQDSDPSHETLGLVMDDPDGSLSMLQTRSGMPVRVEIQYNAGDPTKTSTLFTGYTLEAAGKQKGGTRKAGFARNGAANVLYPNATWNRFTLKAMGEWQRLNELMIPRTIGVDWDGNLAKGVPPVVTDFVRALLISCGYPATMVDVPDLPMRFIGDGKTPMIFEPFTLAGPLVVQLVRDYLGGFLCFDANATNGGAAGNKFGCWRVVIPPQPDITTHLYKNLAEFYLKPFDPAAVSSSIAPIAYPTDISGKVRTWMRKGTYVRKPVPPEANVICVTGVGAPPAGNSQFKKGEVQIMRIVHNWTSAWFYAGQEGDGHPAPDPSSPDYLGRVVILYYCDTGLNSQLAVDIVTRRLYDVCTHGRIRATFEAPYQLITDATDTLQTRSRPLRFGDPVVVNGEQMFIGSCNPDWSFTRGGTRFQHAAYECFSAPAFQTFFNPSYGQT